MKNGMTYLSCFAAGAGLMYLADIATGKRAWPARLPNRAGWSAAGRGPRRWGRRMGDQVLARHVRSVIDENSGLPARH